MTLEQIIKENGMCPYIFIGPFGSIILEDARYQWAFAVKGDALHLVCNRDKLTDPTIDIRNTLDPEDFK